MSASDDYNKAIDELIKQNDEEIAKLEKEKKKAFRYLILAIVCLTAYCVFIGYIWHG